MSEIIKKLEQYQPKTPTKWVEKAEERIQKMEERLDRASQVVMKLSAALDEYAGTLDDIRVLESYYGSEEWKKDFTDDEANRLPKDLKRGVLSEDAIWNMLEDNRALMTRMEELFRQKQL